ncbi:linalool dehydratase/isomerase domain-containing protein [Rhodococcus erythropolis]|uniref:linalool dehydratase/isomerase domain-containing protein n=1 Tax=Rhodococcus erythropolis TaxID=1833 RepID=UPI002226CD9C|nr:hypothetical protein [Rhodococcus erythropolis]MCW2295467.1 hypothetical protein [Rhodococcus erythropolis]
MNRKVGISTATNSIEPITGTANQAAEVPETQTDERSATNGHTDPCAVTTTGIHPTSILIPERTHRNGPLTRSKQKRALLVLGAVEAAGLGLSLLSKSKRSRAAGLGLMVPGGGDVFNKSPLRATLSAGAASAGLILWIGTGNHIATPLAWLGSAALASRRASSIDKPLDLTRLVIPAAVATAAAVMAKRNRDDFKKQQKVAAETNKYLETFAPPLRGDDRPAPFVGEELTRDELLLARKLLTVALQDHDDWSNYDIIEQFQPSAVRYQINFLSWALSVLQYARMPAFHGYLSEAQRNLIGKYQQRKVWSYWWLENMWGNLESNPDPVRRENVMLTGFLGLQIGAYQSATGDLRYTEPGSLVFEWNENTKYEYSLTTMVDAIRANIESSGWSMIPCEPNWLYAFCNSTAANTFRIHDRMLGTDHWAGIQDGFTKSMDEEFHRVDGTALTFKSMRTGYGNGALPLTSVEMRPLVPNLADRGWALSRAGMWIQNETGQATGTILKDMPRGFDYGNVGGGKILQYAGMIESARETGDEQFALVAWDEMLDTNPPSRENGVLTLPGASLSAHSMIARAAFDRKGGWLDLIERGLPQEWAAGPLLDNVEFDQAMVARAETDGKALSFVLHPVDRDTTTKTELARLQPESEYTVAGAGEVTTITADAEGRAVLRVTLNGRTEVTVTPTAGHDSNPTLHGTRDTRK